MVTESSEGYFWISTRSSHKGAIFRNPRHSSNWFYRISGHLGYKHTFCQKVVTTKHHFSLYFLRNIICWSVGLLRIYRVYSISCKSVYRWVMKYCCFISDVSSRPVFFSLVKPTSCTFFRVYWISLYMFRMVFPSIIRSSRL